MKSPGTSAPRLSLWMLPPPPDDGDEFRLGPPPLDLAYGLRAYALVRLLTAALAVVQHAVIALVTGDRGWWLVVAVAAFHAIVMVPVGTALGRRAGWMTPLVDATSILVGALIIGDPVVIVFWAPMVLLSVLVFFGGRRAQAGLMITTVCVLLAFGLGASGLVDSPLATDVLRLHAVLSFLTMGVIVWAYTYTIGAAVRRKDLVLARAEAGRSEALRQADIRAAQLETLFDATPVGLSLQSIDTRFLHVNQRFCDIVGMSAEEVLEHGVVPLFDPPTLTRVRRAIGRARRDRQAFTLEYPITTPAGDRKWIEHSGHVLELESGPGIASTVVDLTSERTATARSRRFAAALEATSDLVVMWDATGTVLHANRAFQAQWQSGDVAGRPLAEVVGAQASVWTAMADEGASAPREVDIVLENGVSIAASILVTRSSDERALMSPVVYTAAIRDIGEVVEARRQLEGLLSAKDQFIASVSHELRTPLTVVMGMAHELAKRPDDFAPDEAHEIVEMISEQSTDLAAMVEDLLTAARAEAGVLTVSNQPIDLGPVVQEAMLGLPAEAIERVTLTTCDHVDVMADPVRARQVVRNLLTNARRYGGSHIGVRVGAKGTRGFVEVCDDGPPIPAGERTRIFEAYGRAHERVGTPDSVGLGLTVSRGLARLMDGDVTYRHDGSWSIFTFEVPLVGDEEPQPVPVATPSLDGARR